MLNTVVFVSKSAFKNHVKAARTMIAISIGDDQDPPPRLNRGFAGVIRLNFVDQYEEAIGCKDGDFPDLHPLHATGRRLFYQGDELCDYNDARKVVRFLNHYSAQDLAFDVVVHCHAGVSRSAAVAQFVADRYGARIDNANPSTSAANKRMLRLLNKVADGVPPVLGEMPKKLVIQRTQTYSGPIGIF